MSAESRTFPAVPPPPRNTREEDSISIDVTLWEDGVDQDAAPLAPLLSHRRAPDGVIPLDDAEDAPGTDPAAPPAMEEAPRQDRVRMVVHGPFNLTPGGSRPPTAPRLGAVSGAGRPSSSRLPAVAGPARQSTLPSVTPVGASSSRLPTLPKGSAVTGPAPRQPTPPRTVAVPLADGAPATPPRSAVVSSSSSRLPTLPKGSAVTGPAPRQPTPPRTVAVPLADGPQRQPTLPRVPLVPVPCVAEGRRPTPRAITPATLPPSSRSGLQRALGSAPPLPLPERPPVPMELVGVVLAPVEEEVPAREEVLCPPPPPEGDEDSLPRAQAVAVPDYRSTRVLVVDPEGGGGVELAKSLESMGFSPVVARTGQEACQKMDGGGWAACVLVTGPDPAWARMVLRVGKQRYPGVCFLAATGEADPDVTAGLVVEGAADVLEPPWPKGLALAASMHVAMPDRVAPPPGTHGRVLVELASRHVKAIRAAVQAEGAPPLADAGESLLDRRGVTQLADALVALRDPLGQAAAYLERLAMAGVAVDGEAGRHLATLRAVQAELGKAGRLRVR